jgi:hypothetical protein
VECDTDGNEHEDETDDPLVDCYPKLVISAYDLCSSSTGPLESCIDFSWNGTSFHPDENGNWLDQFTCIGNNPCASTAPVYCWLEFPTEIFHGGVDEVAGLGEESTADEACGVAVRGDTSGQTISGSLTVGDLAGTLNDIFASCLGYPSGSRTFDVNVAALCKKLEDATVTDTGADAVTLALISETFPDAEFAFILDPAESTISIQGSDTEWDSTEAHGALIAADSPARFLAGGAFGRTITVDGVSYASTWAGFNIAMLVDVDGGTFTLYPASFQDVWWSGVRSTGSVRVGYDIAPSAPVEGEINVGSGTWSLAYEQNLPGGRQLVVAFSGFLESL